MAGSAMEKLLYSIGLLDHVTGPASKITKAIEKVHKTAVGGFQSIGRGAVGLTAAGLAMYGMIDPALGMTRALNDVRSLGVAETELVKLEKAADRFTMKYGGNAADVVASSYDIQSAIQGLGAGDLARFTIAGAVLAKGGKATKAEITDYFGTMHGIFEEEAKRLGNGKWVEIMTGQTATAIQLFKTTAPKMAQAFAALGADAQKAGASMAEQMAILGMLQKTMSGSESATKYRAFLAGVGKAQQALGLQFTDSEGRMLPMVQILEKIKGKFGDTLDVAESDALRKAFGSQGAFALINNLLGKTGNLNDAIEKLSKVDGMGAALKMAAARSDIFQAWFGTLSTLQKNFSKLVVKGIEPFVEWMNGAGETLNRWMGKFPKLMTWIGRGVIVFIAITAAVSAFTIVMGMAKLVWAACLAFKVAVMMVKAWTGAQWLLNTALALNPIGLIIYAILGLAVAVAALIYYYDDLYEYLNDSTVGQVLLMFIDNFIDGLNIVWELLKNLWYFLTGDWQSISFAKIGDIIAGIGARFKWLMGLGGMLWQSLKGVFSNIGGKLGWVLNKLSKIPGMGFLANDTTEDPTAKPQPVVSGVSEARKVDIPAGGIDQTIANSNTTNYGGVNIYTTDPVSPAMLEERFAMAGG